MSSVSILPCIIATLDYLFTSMRNNNEEEGDDDDDDDDED
jgi:hypothetical protein